MMNTYFYSASALECSEKCDYRTCTMRCLSRIVSLRFFCSLRVLPGGTGMNTAPAMELRSGDIIILYAANKEDIDKLLSIKDFFDTFRIILVVGDDSVLQYGRHYSLNPRFTIPLGKNMERLSAVIDRMLAGHERPADYPQTQQEQSYA